MTTQYTPTLKLALPVTGELSGTWGDTVNDNITSMIEQAIAGLSTINTWTANAHTLTTANGTTSESRCAMLVAATGAGGTALTGVGEIICPSAAKLYVVQNTTAFVVTLKTSAGTGVAVAAGDTAFLFCDATNVNSCVTTIVNGNITGNLTVGGNATINGNTTLGNATSDTITATARFASDLVPSTDNARDLGSAANSWRSLWIDGTATMALVAITGGTIDGVSIGSTTAATIINVDNLRLDGNTLSSTDTNGNVVIAPNGTGDVQLDADTVRVGDAAAAATLTSNGAGALTVTTGGTADLTLSTNAGVNSGTVVIANGVNGNITLTPNGTGDVILSADRVQMGDSNTDTTLTTNGTGNLNLTTNDGTNSGTIQIAQGINGNITLTPNGTGSVSVPKLVWSNGTTTRVPYLTTGGQFTDSANLTFSGTSLSTTQIDITAQGTLRLQDTTGGEYVALRAPATLAANYTLTFPADDGTSGQALITDGSGVLSWSTAASGDVYGPASSTDDALARFDSTTGKLIQNSVGILSDAGVLTGLTGLTSSGSITFSSLTSGRVPYATTAGLLTDSANLTFDGTNLGLGSGLPSSGIASASFAGLQVRNATSAAMWGSDYSSTLSVNAYPSTIGSVFTRGGTSYRPSKFSQFDGAFTWNNAAAAGTTITWTDLMVLDVNGKLLLGLTTGAGLSNNDFAMVNAGSIRFRNAANSAYISAFYFTPSNGLDIGTGGSLYNITFGISGIGEVARFNNSTGYLGLFNQAPAAMLDVGPTTSPSQVAAILRGGAGIGNTGGLGLYTNDVSATARNWGIVANSSAYGDFSIRQGTSIGSNPLSAGADRFYISNVGDVGIGGTPANTAGYTTLTLNNATNGGFVALSTGGVQKGGLFNAGNNVYLDCNNSAGNLYIRNTSTGSTATIDSVGNLGLGGVTPSNTSTSYRTVQIKSLNATTIVTSDYSSQYATNAYWTGSAWTRGGNDYAPVLYNQFNGAHTFSNAAAAGTTITFTTLAILNSDMLYAYVGVNPSSNGAGNARIFNSSSGSGTVTLYVGNQTITTSSDVRLKENIVDTQRNALELLGQLRVVDHTWNDPSDQCENNRNSRGTWMGLIAQEAQPVIPWLVNKPTEDVDENGDPQYWHMDYGYSVPLLVKAIQELKAEIDSLKSQLNGA